AIVTSLDAKGVLPTIVGPPNFFWEEFLSRGYFTASLHSLSWFLFTAQPQASLHTPYARRHVRGLSRWPALFAKMAPHRSSSQPTPPSTTLSTSNAISRQPNHTACYAPRR